MQAFDAAATQPLVLDTNIVLDVWLFADPASAALRHALLSGAVRVLATQAMHQELARVLDYPVLRERLGCATGRPLLDAQRLVHCHSCHVQTVASAPKAPYTCQDPDDQMFIDLAVQHRARLLSKDRHVLSMRKRLARLGVVVARHWLPGDAEAMGTESASCLTALKTVSVPGKSCKSCQFFSQPASAFVENGKLGSLAGGLGSEGLCCPAARPTL
jgi:putative PIN family toxin of toxin-antitoxin system